MAYAAETLKRPSQEFDFDLAEIQFAEEVKSVRPAASEIYGRSLSTIYRLGKFAVEKMAAEIIRSPEAAQARVEFYTSVEEGFGTDMELGGGLEVRDFDARPVIDGKVMAKDLKTPISDMTQAGLVCAEETAKTDLHFLPQLTRSKWDHENALMVDKMVLGEADYNTRIIVSPFPEEAAARSGDAYWRGIGYVPHLKRGFVQLYHYNGTEMIAGSLSFDGSNKQRLQEIFGRYGVELPQTEVTDDWLQHAITDTLTVDEAKALALEIADAVTDPAYQKNTNTVDITHGHRAIMDRVFDESYIHACESLARGCQTPGVRQLIFQLADKANSFNDRYANALYGMRANKDQFTDDDMVVLHELLVYSTIEMMRSFYLRQTDAVARGMDVGYAQAQDMRYLEALSPELFQNNFSGFGADGALSGRAYSACGLSISPGELAKLGDSPQSPYGGVEGGLGNHLGEDKFGPLTFKCKYGHLNKRPPGKLIHECRVKSCKNSVKC